MGSIPVRVTKKEIGTPCGCLSLFSCSARPRIRAHTTFSTFFYTVRIFTLAFPFCKIIVRGSHTAIGGIPRCAWEYELIALKRYACRRLLRTLADSRTHPLWCFFYFSILGTRTLIEHSAYKAISSLFGFVGIFTKFRLRNGFHALWGRITASSSPAETSKDEADSRTSLPLGLFLSSI